MRKGTIENFQKIEFLAWIDSPMCAESNGVSFILTIFMHSGRYIRHFSENMPFLIKFCINLCVSEQILVPIDYSSHVPTI